MIEQNAIPQSEALTVSKAVLQLVVIVAVINLAITQVSLVVRPELQYRDEAEKLYDIASTLSSHGAYDQAIHYFEQVVQSSSHTNLAPSASYSVANLYLSRKFDMYHGREALARTVDFSGSEAANRAAKDLAFANEHWGADGSPLKLWYQAVEAEKANQLAEAVGYLEPLCGDSPVVSLRPLALFKKGQLLAKMGQNDESKKVLESLIVAYPKHALADRARTLLGRKP